MSEATGPHPKPAKNAVRNEKDRKRRADGLLRHKQDLAEKQAEIDHLQGSLTGVLGQMANFKGVADIIRDNQKSIQPWDDNGPANLEECRGCGGRGIRDGMEIARLTAICRKSDCGPLENDIVRLRQQIATLEKRNADLEEGRDNFESVYAGFEKQLARKDAKLEAEEKEEADLEATLEKEKADLEAALEKENADLEAEILELKLEHKLDYKKLDDQNNHLIEERLQQENRIIGLENRIIDLESQIQLVKDDLAYGPMEGSVAGAGDDLSAEEQAYQQAQRQHSS